MKKPKREKGKVAAVRRVGKVGLKAAAEEVLRRSGYLERRGGGRRSPGSC